MDSITYCKGHGWQVLAGTDIDQADIEACAGCIVVRR